MWGNWVKDLWEFFALFLQIFWSLKCVKKAASGAPLAQGQLYRALTKPPRIASDPAAPRIQSQHPRFTEEVVTCPVRTACGLDGAELRTNLNPTPHSSSSSPSSRQQGRRLPRTVSGAEPRKQLLRSLQNTAEGRGQRAELNLVASSLKFGLIQQLKYSLEVSWIQRDSVSLV